MTQDISKMVYETETGALISDRDYQFLTREQQSKCKVYTAALTSPASGWVKASERTPIGYLLKCLKFTAPDIACEKGVVGCMAVGRYNVASKGWIINGRASDDDVQDLEWLDETLLPEQRQPIDTLRQWMAIGGNITAAAEKVVGLMIDDDHHGATYKELVASVENFICTEMFKGYTSDETPLPTVEECMEYAKGLSSVFWGSKDELKLFIEYAQKHKA